MAKQVLDIYPLGVYYEHMEKTQEKILNRLSRLEGQIRGIKRMIEEGADCQKVVVQIMAVKEACSRVGLELMRTKVCSNKKINPQDLENIFKVIK